MTYFSVLFVFSVIYNLLLSFLQGFFISNTMSSSFSLSSFFLLTFSFHLCIEIHHFSHMLVTFPIRIFNKFFLVILECLFDGPTSEPYLFLFLFTTSSLDSGFLFPLLLFCMFHVRYDKTLEVEVNSIYVQKR